MWGLLLRSSLIDSSWSRRQIPGQRHKQLLGGLRSLTKTWDTCDTTAVTIFSHGAPQLLPLEPKLATDFSCTIWGFAPRWSLVNSGDLWWILKPSRWDVNNAGFSPASETGRLFAAASLGLGKHNKKGTLLSLLATTQLIQLLLRQSIIFKMGLENSKECSFSRISALVTLDIHQPPT